MKKRFILRDFQDARVDISDAVAIPAAASGSTRELTPEGYLKAIAAVTRVGIQYYLARQFGIDSDDKIPVFRPPETVFHPETIESLKLKPIVFLHPEEDVDSKNYNRLAVGTVGENVGPLDDFLLGAPIQITDESIVKKIIEKEINELSLGYEVMVVSDEGEFEGEKYLYRMDGPMINNHLAIVPDGRCGDTVKILDKNENQNGGFKVNKKQMIKILQDAGISADKIKGFMSGKPDDADGDIKAFVALLKAGDMDISALVPDLVAELKPALEEIVNGDEFKKMLAVEMASALTGSGNEPEPEPEPSPDAEEEEAPAMTQEEMDAAINDAAEDRAALIKTAEPFLPKEFKIKDSKNKDIIFAALEAVGMKKDEMESHSEDYLRGLLDSISNDRDAARRFSQDGAIAKIGDAKISRPATALDIRKRSRK